MIKRWDIFCRVIDNYGDIGICWRLSQQLAHEHGIRVRLWVNDLAVAKKLIPKLDVKRKTQIVHGVKICHWQKPFPLTKPADVVIEAFACELPHNYLSAMAKTKPVWLNLEYLSAENWVTGAHLKQSPHPKLPLNKYFFFPGFNEKTGGLIRESILIQERDNFQQSKNAQSAFWKELGITPDTSLKISLFYYPHAPIEGLLEAISNSGYKTTIFLPDSSAHSANLFSRFKASNSASGNLALKALPFLSQKDYDHLLWACDINFVRGEDSWIRALWAAKPFVWQPYQQSENTHMEKLNAFLGMYTAGLENDARQVLQETHQIWNSGEFSKADWLAFLDILPALQKHASEISSKLANEPDLAAKLVIFCKNLLK